MNTKLFTLFIGGGGRDRKGRWKAKTKKKQVKQIVGVWLGG